MLIHYLKIAIRSILWDKGYSIVNILGLSIAIACCFLLIFWVKFEMSFENCYQKADRTYRLMEVEKRTDGLHHSLWIRPGIADDLKSKFPQIEAATYLYNERLPLIEKGKEGDGIMANVVNANEDFLRMFDYEYVEGSPQSVAQERGCLLSEEAAHKFFGNESAIGKTLSFASEEGYTIKAVVKLPKNTQVRFDLLNVAGQIGYGVHYVMLKEHTALSPELRKQIADFLSTTKETKNTLVLQPLRDIHLHSPKEVAVNSDDIVYGNLSQIYFFSVAVLLILFIAIINYVNTSIARAMNRMKEVGVRKVTGANKRQLIDRFLFESFIMSLVSVLFALMLVKLLFPEFSQVMGNQIVFDFDGASIGIAILVCLLITILSGGYAAFYLSSFSPITIFRGGSKTGSKDRLRMVLVGIQFFLSVGVLICTFVMYKQIHAIFNAETGVDRKNILVLETSLWYQAEDFIKIIKQENPNILEATIAGSAPYNSSWGYSGVSWEGCKEDVKEMEFTQIFCDHNYASTFGLQMLDGQFIPPGLTWWQYAEAKSFNIVINESFKKLMGEENPIGITVFYGWGMKGKIIGVVKDFNFKPLKENISPLIISFNPESCMSLFIKTTGKDKQKTLDYILAKYKEMKPDYAKRPVMYHTVEDDYNKMYEVELRTAGMLSVFSIISFVLSLLGIISMISFMIEKRTKEIAIRKINGATILDIIRLFAGDILKIAAIASVIAIPISYLLMAEWLQDYVYRTPLSWWIFLLIPFFLMLITFLVIAVQVYYTARQNPVESLRSE